MSTELAFQEINNAHQKLRTKYANLSSERQNKIIQTHMKCAHLPADQQIKYHRISATRAARAGDIDVLQTLYAYRPSLENTISLDDHCLLADAFLYGHYCTACWICGHKCCRSTHIQSTYYEYSGLPQITAEAPQPQPPSEQVMSAFDVANEVCEHCSYMSQSDLQNEII